MLNKERKQEDKKENKTKRQFTVKQKKHIL